MECAARGACSAAYGDGVALGGAEQPRAPGGAGGGACGRDGANGGGLLWFLENAMLF